MVLRPLPGRNPSPSPKSWSSGPLLPSPPPRARSRPRAPRSLSRPPRSPFPERCDSSIARILSSARCMASRARSVCPPSSASIPSLASPLQLPPLRPRRSISSSSSRSFWGEMSGESPLSSDLDFLKTILYCELVKSDWRSGSRSTCSSSLSRSSPFFRKLLKSGRWLDSAVSLKIAERSPAVDPLPVPLFWAKSRSSTDGRLSGVVCSGRDRSSISSVVVRSSRCSGSVDGVKSPIVPSGRCIAGANARTSPARSGAGSQRPSSATARRTIHRRPRVDERAAQPPALGAADPDRPRDPPDNDFDRLRMSHGVLSRSGKKDFSTAGRNGLCSLHDLADQGVGVHPLGLALEVQDDPVTQGRHGEGLDVLRAHVVTPLREGPDLGAQHERLGAARAGAVPHEPTRDLGRAGPGRVRRHHDGGRQVADVRGDRHLADQLAERKHRGPVHHAAHRHVP